MRIHPVNSLCKAGGILQTLGSVSAFAREIHDLRSDAADPFLSPVQFLKGVGPHLATKIERVSGGTLVRDLLFTAPTGLVDWRVRSSIADAPLDEEVVVEVAVDAHYEPPRGRGAQVPYKVRVRDLTGFLTLVFYRGNVGWLEKQLPVGERRLLAGKIAWHRGERQMTHPDHIIDPAEGGLEGLEPIYPLTEGLSGRQMQRFVQAALPSIPRPAEWLDPSLLAREKWASFNEALRQLHAPKDPGDIAPQGQLRTRLAYDELFLRQAALRLRRAERRKESGALIENARAGLGDLVKGIRFTPTGAQMRALDDIGVDLGTAAPMHRLLQGDVGSGKTLVAALTAAVVVKSGWQVAVMAPTSILARQLHEVFSSILSHMGITCSLFLGSDGVVQRRTQRSALAAGEISIAIGTHALFQKDVAFQNLGLIVVDEQHRFGVADRARLATKGVEPHVLAMSATPIPRTLALAVHGDMDLSILDEKPPGRAPITTRLVGHSRIEEVIEGLDRALAADGRAYWVCPLVSDSETSDLAAAEARAEHLRSIFGSAVGLIHGQMPPARREAEMNRFRTGEIKLLVATVVIEVGVDVPEATIMVIEHAERYGLAQLHQLRGRVGRGGRPGSCVLLYTGPLSEAGELRLKTMRETDDGFRIAEVDYKLRGAGDVLGSRQSGFAAHRFVVPGVHDDLLMLADKDARMAVDVAADLQTPRGLAIREGLRLFGLDQRLARSETA
jgi:ATP-dependent DNA helicase RecG